MISKRIQEHINTVEFMLNDASLLASIQFTADQMTKCFTKKSRVFFCGNGGSAADAQHLAAELSGRFYLDRAPLNAEALHVNSSFITAIGNDYGFNSIFARQLEAKASAGDLLIALSTSGNSANVINCINKAKELHVQTIGWTGSKSSEMEKICDHLIKIPSENTPRIQEAHILIGHIICEQVEQNLFG